MNWSPKSKRWRHVAAVACILPIAAVVIPFAIVARLLDWMANGAEVIRGFIDRFPMPVAVAIERFFGVDDDTLEAERRERLRAAREAADTAEGD